MQIWDPDIKTLLLQAKRPRTSITGDHMRDKRNYVTVMWFWVCCFAFWEGILFHFQELLQQYFILYKHILIACRVKNWKPRLPECLDLFWNSVSPSFRPPQRFLVATKNHSTPSPKWMQEPTINQKIQVPAICKDWIRDWGYMLI